jgi:hypothetical protein
MGEAPTYVGALLFWVRCGLDSAPSPVNIAQSIQSKDFKSGLQYALMQKVL